MGLTAVLPVGRQRGVAVMAVRPLGGLEAGEELAVGKLVWWGIGWWWSRQGGVLESQSHTPPHRDPFPTLTLLGGGGLGEHCDSVW